MTTHTTTMTTMLYKYKGHNRGTSRCIGDEAHRRRKGKKQTLKYHQGNLSPCPRNDELCHVRHRLHPNSPGNMTDEKSASSDDHPMNDTTQLVALDCEMVGVGPGGNLSVLARVSVIDGNGVTMLDTFIRVKERVSDYRTIVSGVRPGDLCGPNAMDFGKCRRQVLDLIRNKVLVGHGLQNDLNIMKISHPLFQIRDTSLYEPFMNIDHFTGRLRPQKLKTLSKMFLGREIQTEGTAHDSCIDAQAALDLYMSVQKEWEDAVTLAHMSVQKEWEHAVTLAQMQYAAYASPPYV